MPQIKCAVGLFAHRIEHTHVARGIEIRERKIGSDQPYHGMLNDVEACCLAVGRMDGAQPSTCIDR